MGRALLLEQIGMAMKKTMPTVLSLNATKKQKAANRRIQITFINPPHHGKGRSATSYEDD